MSEPNHASGGCLCAAVAFTVALPSKWVAHCHCTRCRAAHGAPLVTWVGVDESGATIDDPAQVLRWYESSPGAQRGFCSRCGSTLFFRSSRWPGELHIVRANFTGPLDREPQAHVFYDTHVAWLTVTDDLPKKPDPDVV
jgi:hypothetical protein